MSDTEELSSEGYDPSGDDNRLQSLAVQCTDDVTRTGSNGPQETLDDVTTPKELRPTSEKEVTDPSRPSRQAESRVTDPTGSSRHGEEEGSMKEVPDRPEDNALATHGAVVESSISGVPAAQRSPPGNQLSVNVNKLSGGAVNFGGDIHNNVTADHYSSHTTVHNYNTFNYGMTNIYVQRGQADRRQAVEDRTEPTTDDVSHISHTWPQVKEVMGALEQDGRVLLCALPDNTRSSLLSTLEQEHRKLGYDVCNLIDVDDCHEKGLPDSKCLLIINYAFGDVRLDRAQYKRMFRTGLYSIGHPVTNHIVFLLFPHILKELQQHDTVTHQNMLKMIKHVTLEQDSSVSDYVNFLIRMLRDHSHGQKLGALLVLTMQGNSCFVMGQGQVEAQLERLEFQPFRKSDLQEFASLLVDFLLAETGEGFVTRDVYNAAGLAVAKVYSAMMTLQACDVKFLTQHVRTTHVPITDNSLLLKRPSEVLLLMERMCEAMVTGQLPEMSQHPCLQSQQFFEEFQAYLEQNDQLLAVLTAVDPQHGLPLLYWSVWSLSCVFPEWCLALTMSQHTDGSVLQDHMFRAAVLTALLMRTTDTDLSQLLDRFRDKVCPMTKMITTMKLSLPLPQEGQRYTDQLDSVCNSMASCLTTSPLCCPGTPSVPIPEQLLTVELAEDVIQIKLPCRLMNLSLRLLSDREVDEEDREGNTLLHVAADTGQLQVVHMLVQNGASLLAENKAGLTPPQLVARWGKRCHRIRMSRRSHVQG